MGDKDELYARLSAISEKMGLGFTEDEVKNFGDRSDYLEMRAMMVSAYNARGGTQITEDAFQEVNKRVSGQFDDRLRLNEGAKELLEYLNDKKYPLALVTTRGGTSLTRLLERHGFNTYFHTIVRREDCKAKKPEPNPIAIGLERLNVDPKRAMYVGDKQVDDIIAGKVLGMKTVLVGVDPLDKYGAQPDYQVASPKQLLNLFKKYERSRL